MPAIWVVMVYSAAVVLAALLLYLFEPLRWYWHALSIVLAIGIGLMPLPPEWKTPACDLAVGFFFTLFFFWGVGAPLFRTFHRPHVCH